MTKVDIFSGFLGAGKTTLIKKLIAEAYAGQKIVLIENEFGDIAIDGGFMAEAGIQVNELNSGCICCSLVGDFSRALQQVVAEYAPDRILIEPSGVGKLSEIISAVAGVEGMEIASATAVCDAGKCRMYMKNFGEFYSDQVSNAGAIVLSRTQNLSETKLAAAVELLREKNPDAVIVTTPWDQLSGEQILEAICGGDTLARLLEEVEHHHHEHHHHEHHHEHHHHEHEDDCDCGCHGHHHEHEHEHEEHEHHHHHHGEECHDPDCHCHEHEHHHHEDCGCHEHEHEHEHHHHEHDDDCDCGCHEHHHHEHEHEHEHEHHHHHHGHECDDPNCSCHHDHDADEVFVSWGAETAHKYTEDEIADILKALDDEKYGLVLRAKGIVDAADGQWIHFDHVPGEADVRRGAAGIIGRFCVIGSDLDEEALKQLFKL